MIFHDITITAVGERMSARIEDSDKLAVEAVRFFADWIAGRQSFREPANLPPLKHLELQWTSMSPATALATFWAHGNPLTTSVLLRGTDPVEEADAITSAQGLILSLLRDTGSEPAFDLRWIKDRPVIASIVLPSATIDEDLLIVADMERCLAAAFFTR